MMYQKVAGRGTVSGVSTLLFVAILVIELVHIVRMETWLKYENPSSMGSWHGDNKLVSFKDTSNIHKFDQEESHRMGLSGDAYPLEEQSFSACLMFMDDNAHLIEWLAYHYHSLPLRRLIVAVDPRSQTSPSSILERWNGLIEITEWSDIDFMPPRLMDAHLQNLVPAELTKLFRQRQEEFYARCMARLKYEGRTWVALVDTDEYIKLNTHSQRYFAYMKHLLNENTPRTVLDALNPRKENYKVDDNSEKNTAVAQEHQLSEQIDMSPCFPMARLSFGVKESETSDLYTGVIPWGFDPKDFQSLRWRWHAGRSKKSVNKISKALIDVSRVDSSLFVPTEQVMVHLPIKEYCHGEDDLWILNAHSLLVVHHYGGTWEQWSHRGSSDPRGKRTREAYNRMKYGTQMDDTIRPWLAQFVKDVGWWTARRLLRGVGQL